MIAQVLIGVMKNSGEEIRIAWFDGGECIGRDANGLLYEAWRDILIGPNFSVVVEHDRNLLEGITNKLEFRVSEMVAHLESIGIDGNSIRQAEAIGVRP